MSGNSQEAKYSLRLRHFRHGATNSSKLRFHPDHSVGADRHRVFADQITAVIFG